VRVFHSLLACCPLCCSNVTIELFQAAKPVKVLCPGGQYEVKVRHLVTVPGRCS
jgi:hypothetical protein